MTSHSDSADSRPVEQAKPNWHWLSARVRQARTEEIDAWLDEQLAALEQEFADYATPRSRMREVRHGR